MFRTPSFQLGFNLALFLTVTTSGDQRGLRDNPDWLGNCNPSPALLARQVNGLGQWFDSSKVTIVKPREKSAFLFQGHPSVEPLYPHWALSPENLISWCTVQQKLKVSSLRVWPTTLKLAPGKKSARRCFHLLPLPINRKNCGTNWLDVKKGSLNLFNTSASGTTESCSRTILQNMRTSRKTTVQQRAPMFGETIGTWSEGEMSVMCIVCNNTWKP